MLENKKIEEIHQMVRNNNKMIRGMKRAAFWGGILKLIFWIAMLGIPVYVYFTFAQPIIADLISTYDQIQQVSGKLQETTNSLQMDKFKAFLRTLPSINK